MPPTLDSDYSKLPFNPSEDMLDRDDADKLISAGLTSYSLLSRSLYVFGNPGLSQYEADPEILLNN